MSEKTMNSTKYLLIIFFITVINGSNSMVPMVDFFLHGPNVSDTDIRNDYMLNLDDGSSHPIQQAVVPLLQHRLHQTLG